MFKHYTHIQDLEIELTSTCNSMCPHCARVLYDENNNILATNPRLPSNAYLNPNIIENIAQSDLITENTEIRLSGAFSDPLMHPQLLDIVTSIYKFMPQVKLRITTNGSARSPEYVRKVANVLSKWKKHRSCFDFSIDGLADTNGLYRYNVSFQKAYNNMLSAIESGCRVKWHCIVFPWNKHQITEIKRQADELNIEFEAREARPANFETDIQYVAVKQNLVTSKKSTYKKVLNTAHDMHFYGKKKYDYINPRCINDVNSMFIGFDNCVYVCCSQFTDRYTEYDIAFNKHLDMDSKWNDLTKYSINDIVSNENWDKLYASIDNRPFNYCVDECGECK